MIIIIIIITIIIIVVDAVLCGHSMIPTSTVAHGYIILYSHYVRHLGSHMIVLLMVTCILMHQPPPHCINYFACAIIILYSYLNYSYYTLHHRNRKCTKNRLVKM